MIKGKLFRIRKKNIHNFFYNNFAIFKRYCIGRNTGKKCTIDFSMVHFNAEKSCNFLVYQNITVRSHVKSSQMIHRAPFLKSAYLFKRLFHKQKTPIIIIFNWISCAWQTSLRLTCTRKCFGKFEKQSVFYL